MYCVYWTCIDRIHTVGLQRIDDVHTDFYQIRQQAGEIAVTVVKNKQLRRFGLDDVDNPRQTRPEEFAPGLRADYQAGR